MKFFRPNFRTTFLIVGYTFVFLAVSLFAKGLLKSMSEFQVPQAVLDSPHYVDAIQWVYIHMITLGLLIVSIGYSVTDVVKQKRISILLFFISSFYTYLDFRSSDSALGNALYKGDASIIPAVISLVVTLLFLQLSLRRNKK